MPLRIARSGVSPSQLDALLACGYRRSGNFFYRTQCPRCNACEPLRIAVETFQPSRSQRRAKVKGDAALRCELQSPTIDARRIELFDLHRHSRNLSHSSTSVGYEGYHGFLLSAQCDVGELSLWDEQRLVGVAILDIGATSLSAVYCFFDPEYSALSPGTYAIMKQVELAQCSRKQWLYLGMYVAKNRHLNYKSRFGPNQRWVNEQWVLFDRT